MVHHLTNYYNNLWTQHLGTSLEFWIIYNNIRENCAYVSLNNNLIYLMISVEYVEIFTEKKYKKTIGIRLDNVRVLLPSRTSLTLL